MIAILPSLIDQLHVDMLEIPSSHSQPYPFHSIPMQLPHTTGAERNRRKPVIDHFKLPTEIYRIASSVY